jgi:alginate O-acetyltransferase complex protein AlgI
MFGVLLMAEKWIPWLQNMPRFLKHIYVLLVICISFVLFRGESLAQVGEDLRGMFGLSGLPLITRETVYYLRSFGALFVAGIIGATPLVKRTAGRLGGSSLGAVLEAAFMAVLLVVCTAYLVDGSFSPFLYFRF